MFVLYPFGERGKLVKSILNVYFGVQEALIIDNYLTETYPETIKPLTELSAPKYRDAVVLITSDLPASFAAIRDALYKTFPKERCIEVFEEIIAKDAKRESGEVFHERVLAKLDECDMEDNGMRYSPSGTRSKFWLPYVYSDLIQGSIFLNENYFEINNLAYVLREFRGGEIQSRVRGNVVVDIGANIGNHTLYFANEAQAGRVIAFEPVPETFRILKKNIAINNLRDKVELYCCGLGNKMGYAFAPIYSYENIGGTGLMVTEEGTLNIRTLDSIPVEGDVALIKIDVEGMELSVLEGAIQTLKKHRPYIMIESFPNQYPQVERFLTSLNYICGHHFDEANHIFCMED